MNKNSFLKHILLFALTVILLVSCDNDFNELGANIAGVDNFLGEPESKYQVTTTVLETGIPESTDLTANALGIYDNPVFGLTTANFATQLELDSESIDREFNLDLQPYIQSVVLTVPYYSTKMSTEADGSGNYRLDSIYGPNPASTLMKLSVYESGYFMRDINPIDQLAQSYYTDQNVLFDNAKIPYLGNPLNTDSDQNQNEKFFFNNAENTAIVKSAPNLSVSTDSVSTTLRNVPVMKLNLNKNFIMSKIFQAPAGKLLNNNVFKDYFRGLYFKVEQSGSSKGNLGMLNFKAGKITITYREYVSVPNPTPPAGYKPPARTTKTLVLNMTGRTVSLISQGSPYVTPNSQQFALKGGAKGSMAIIDLFTPAELTQIKKDKWLINDASLTFTIAKDAMNTGDIKAAEPKRVYLYDLTNNRALIDYQVDQSASSVSTKFNKSTFGGIIKKGSDDRGTTYKIRLTKHLIRIVRQDSTNVRLGLVVTEDINNTATKKIKTPVLDGKIKTIPLMATVHPLGTILYGSNIPVGDPNYDKRPKLEIYYTKPK